MSSLKVVAFSFDAFSEISPYINKKAAVCLPSLGPIPQGAYYILDRQSGGLLGPLWDRLKGRKDWFSLYSIDSQIDDIAYCESVERGNSRLHPKGVYGISKGCIVIDHQSDFQHLYALLKSIKPIPIPNTNFSAYGTVVVR